MRKTIHLCLSSHDEVMYRSEEDLNMGFNCLALAILETESRLLAEGFMTTHHHILLQTDDYKEVMYRSRFAYSRYFNAKYHRNGRLGEKNYFWLEVEGVRHLKAALNYVLRQGLHHGICATPFEYRHCSANAIFRKELGKVVNPELLPDKSRHNYLPRNKRIDSDRYRMAENGLLLREEIVDTAYVEQIYISPQKYMFQMNKKTSEQDLEEQKEEGDMPPVTLESIEAGVPDFETGDAKHNEYGLVDNRKMTDLELCKVIDRKIVTQLIRNDESASIYMLPESRRAAIYNRLMQISKQGYRSGAKDILEGKTVTEPQLRRCLAL